MIKHGKNKFGLIGFSLVAIIISYWFAEYRFYMNTEWSEAKISSLITYSAAKPFQYRVLIPWLVRTITDLHVPIPPVHLPSQLWITSVLEPAQAQLFVLIEFISTFLLFLAFRLLIGSIFKKHRLGDLFTLSLILVLPFNFLLPKIAPFWYPSDIPAILFFTLGLLFIRQEKWSMYYLIFIIGSFNRETIGFLTLVFIFANFEKLKPRSILFHTVLQLAIWCAIKFSLYSIFINNPGSSIVQNQFSANLSFLLSPKRYPMLFSNFGFTWILVVVFYRFINDRFIKRSLLVVIPFLIVTLIAGDIWELRIFGELIPIILTGFWLVVQSLIDEKKIELQNPQQLND